jgi:hypothetical protein
VSLIREDDLGPYIVMKGTIYRPPFISLAVAGTKTLTTTNTGRVRYSDANGDEHEEIWDPGETLKEYKEAKSLERQWPEWEDFLGNTYKAGDYVIYAAQYGQSACLKFAQVVRINKCDSAGVAYKRYDLNQGKHVPGASVTLIPIERSKGSLWSDRTTTILDTTKIVKMEGTYMQKFEALETELVDAELERIKEKYS